MQQDGLDRTELESESTQTHGKDESWGSRHKHKL